MKVMKRSAVSGGVVYDWVRDDGTSGHVLVDEGTRTIYPCDASGVALGQMSVSVDGGDVVKPDPETKGRFLVVAAALFHEWKRLGHLPDSVSRSYG
jgi:hypothetical protein